MAEVSMAVNNCPNCDRPGCNGRLNVLREFADYSDLADHTDEETIVKWVNAHWNQREAQKLSHKKYTERNKMLLKAAERMLDPDERALLKRQAAAKVNGAVEL